MAAGTATALPLDRDFWRIGRDTPGTEGKAIGASVPHSEHVSVPPPAAVTAISHIRGERFQFGLFSGPASVLSTLTKDPIGSGHSYDSHTVWGLPGRPSTSSVSGSVSVPEPDGLILAATGLVVTFGFGLIRARARRER
jgi:hypothetical protein